jgi:hypothetical protein
VDGAVAFSFQAARAPAVDEAAGLAPGASDFGSCARVVFNPERGGAIMSNPRPHIDEGIAILHALTKPGQRRSLKEIAEAAGCAKSLIQYHEQTALKKLRERLRRKLQMGYAEFAHTQTRLTPRDSSV